MHTVGLQINFFSPSAQCLNRVSSLDAERSPRHGAHQLSYCYSTESVTVDILVLQISSRLRKQHICHRPQKTTKIDLHIKYISDVYQVQFTLWFISLLTNGDSERVWGGGYGCGWQGVLVDLGWVGIIHTNKINSLLFPSYHH